MPAHDPLRDTLPTIVVRLASAGDGPALARIDLATRTPAVSPAPAPVDANSYRFFTDTTAPGDVFVAEVDGHLAGWVKMQAPTPLLSNAHVLEISGLAVDPARQGISAGHRLVEAAVQECSHRVQNAAASDTGLPEGTPVCAGTVDAWAEAFSVGVHQPGDLMLMYGSTMFFVQVLRSWAELLAWWCFGVPTPGDRSV